MAILQLARRNSGSETAIKVFAVLTENINLHNGIVLLSQFGDGNLCATKLSLFVTLGILPESRTIGERNIWLRDTDDGLLVTCAHEKEARRFIDKLYMCKNWYEAFPAENRMFYNLKHLDRAASDMRNFLLCGTSPSEPVTDEQKEAIDRALKEGEFDVVATLDQDAVDLGDVE